MFRTVFTVLAVTLIIAACGSGSGEDGASPVTTAPPAEQTAPASDTAAAAPATTSDLSVLELMEQSGRYTTLLALLQENELDSFLANQAEVTIFAPTDEAFAMLPAGQVDTIRKNGKHLELFLTPHVLPGQVLLAGDLRDGETLSTMTGMLDITIVDGVVKLDDATVVEADMRGSNGVVHGIDAVITDGIEQ